MYIIGVYVTSFKFAKKKIYIYIVLEIVKAYPTKQTNISYTNEPTVGKGTSPMDPIWDFYFPPKRQKLHRKF